MKTVFDDIPVNAVCLVREYIDINDFPYSRQMAATTLPSGEPAPEDTSLYPIAVLIDELKNEDVQVCISLLVK